MKFECARASQLEIPRHRHHNKTKVYGADQIDIFKEYLSYNADNGDFKWIKRPGRSISMDASPGTIRPDGYKRIHLKGKSHLAHRIAYAMTFGPTLKDIDHINGNRLDNSIKNLRPTSHSENLHNSKRKLTAGAYVDKRCPNNPFCARFNYQLKSYSLGYFKTKELAVSAVVAKKKEMGIA